MPYLTYIAINVEIFVHGNYTNRLFSTLQKYTDTSVCASDYSRKLQHITKMKLWRGDSITCQWTEKYVLETNECDKA